MEKKEAVKEVRLSLARVRVGVVGTGNYGRALRSKLLSVGAEVVWGSRSPGPGTHQVSLVHSHWSSSCITALSLVETFPSDSCASNLMP